MSDIFAWPKGTTDVSDPSKRVRADRSPGKSAICSLCYREVTSIKINGVWRWCHLSRCRPPLHPLELVDGEH